MWTEGRLYRSQYEYFCLSHPWRDQEHPLKSYMEVLYKNQINEMMQWRGFHVPIWMNPMFYLLHIDLRAKYGYLRRLLYECPFCLSHVWFIVIEEKIIEAMSETMSNFTRIISQGIDLLAWRRLDNIMTSNLSISFQSTLQRYCPQISH
jgi:hypothetical protein